MMIFNHIYNVYIYIYIYIYIYTKNSHLIGKVLNIINIKNRASINLMNKEIKKLFYNTQSVA